MYLRLELNNEGLVENFEAEISFDTLFLEHVLYGMEY
jgi:hypothetical protein